MNRDDAEEYTQALDQTAEGTALVAEGWWRQLALGVRMDVPRVLGQSNEQWCDARRFHIRMSIPERREAVAELAQEGMSNVEIGDVLGVDEGTVRNDKKAASENSDAEANEARPVRDASQSRSEDSEPTIPGEDSATPEPEPEPPAPEELTDHNAELRRSNARKMLAKAAAATSELSPSVHQIAEAVVAQHPDALAAECKRIERNRAVWDRLLKSIDQRAAPQLRRVK